MTTVQIKVVGMTGSAGTTHAVLTDMVTLTPVRSVLNQAASFRFGLHNLDPDVAQVLPIAREVQVWRNGSMVAGDGWLVPIDQEATIGGSTDVTEWECRGLQWYFGRRFVGDADRRNYLEDGSFEDATNAPGIGPEWTNVGVTATRETGFKLTKVASAKLVQATAGTDTFLRQIVTITAGGVGALMTLAGWFYLPSTGWVGEALDRRGLFLQRSVSGVVKGFASAAYNTGSPGSMPFDTWVRRKVTIQIPANATEDIEVRLYAPGTTAGIFLDEITLTAMDSVSYFHTDQTEIADGLVVHLQDPAYGKSDLNIGRDTAPSGVLRTKHYQHAEHPPGLRALEEFSQLVDGFDQSIETDTANRTYTTHFPRKGTARAAVEWSELAAPLSHSAVLGDTANTSVVVLGDGDGPDREEGGASDPSAWGGKTLEEVRASSPGTNIDLLDSLAEERLRVTLNSRKLRLNFLPGLRIGSLFTGDTFEGPSTSHGGVDISGDWRVTELELDLVYNSLSVLAEVAA